jgi:hypothetical protein
MLVTKGTAEIEPCSLIKLAVHDWVGTCCVDLAITRCQLPWTRNPDGEAFRLIEVTLRRGGRLAAPMQTIESRRHRLDMVEQLLTEAPLESSFEIMSACKFLLAGQAQCVVGHRSRDMVSGLERSRPAPRP